MSTHVSAAHFNFAFFTDTHVMAGGNYRPSSGDWEFDTDQSLQRVIDVIRGLQERPDFVVIGGDLASPDILDRDKQLSAEDYEPSYQLLLRRLAPLSCPIHFLLGNHDNRIAFKRIMNSDPVPTEDAHAYSFDHLGYHFVILDSLVAGQHAGALDAGQYAWLTKDLSEHAEQPTFVFVHHHPWPIGHDALDTMGLENGEELITSLRDYRQVKWIFCGHVHMDHQVQHDGLTLISTPSTCFQANKLSSEMGTLPGPPAFRIVKVEGARVSTRVVHLSQAQFEQR